MRQDEVVNTVAAGLNGSISVIQLRNGFDEFTVNVVPPGDIRILGRVVIYYANVKRKVGKMANAYERHDISDKSWAPIELLLLERKGAWGGNARDNRQFINAVFGILRTGVPWRDLPPSYGDWENTYRRFCRWRDKGVGENILVELIYNQ